MTVLDSLTMVVTKARGFVSSLQQTNPALLKFGTYTLLAMAVLVPLGLVFASVASGIGLVAGAIGPITAGAYMIYNARDNIKQAFAKRRCIGQLSCERFGCGGV